MTDSALDLCVRTKNDYSYSEVTVKEENEESELKNLSRHQPMLQHLDPNHAAVMMQFQDRIYADEKLHSPPYLSASPSSNGSTSDLHNSPMLSPLSRTMTSPTLLSDPHRSPTYFSDLSPSSGYPMALLNSVHLSKACATQPMILTNGTKGKSMRPFKAYKSNPANKDIIAEILSRTKDAKLNKNGNKNMKRPVQSTSPHQVPSSSGDVKDELYWEKRRKNNEAAKRSRDARRAKEDELAITVAYLEKENITLKAHIEALNIQLEKLRQKNHQSIYA